MILPEVVTELGVPDRTRLRITEQEIRQVIARSGNGLSTSVERAGRKACEVEGPAAVRINLRAQIGSCIASPKRDAVRAFQHADAFTRTLGLIAIQGGFGIVKRREIREVQCGWPVVQRIRRRARNA